MNVLPAPVNTLKEISVYSSVADTEYTINGLLFSEPCSKSNMKKIRCKLQERSSKAEINF